jgi:hypothetical protein
MSMSSFQRPYYTETRRGPRERARRPARPFEDEERWPRHEYEERDEFGRREYDESRDDDRRARARFQDEPFRPDQDSDDRFERYGDLGYDEGRFAPHRESGYGYTGYAAVYGGTPAANRGIRQLGRFAGRGPKGYQRSDERVREDVCDRLMADPEIDAVELSVSVANGEVTLEGSVPERSMKRAAEDCVESISGVRQVHNRLRVEPGTGEERDGDSGASRSARAAESQRSGAGRKPL